MSGYSYDIQRAVELAREGDAEQARGILQQILRQDRDNLEAWFGMARLADTLKEKRFSLKQILRLKPDSDWAAAQLEIVNEQLDGVV